MSDVARIVDWNGRDLPEALSRLPPGRYVIERLDEAAELTIEEEAGVEEALRSDERGESLGVEELRELLRRRRE